MRVVNSSKDTGAGVGVGGRVGQGPAVTPETLKPYLYHGVVLKWGGGRSEALGDCPWCGREGKFAVEIDTGRWRCVVCNEGSNAKGEPVNGGNSHTFLRILWAKSREEVERLSDEVKVAYYAPLVASRRLLDHSALYEWGVVKSILTGGWLVPGYGMEGALNQLYSYSPGIGGKYRLMATAGMPQQLFGTPGYSKTKDAVVLCESVWDAMAFWEVARWAKTAEAEGGSGTERGRTTFTRTSSASSSLLAGVNVLAIPGCNVFTTAWARLLGGKRVVLMLHNDYPRSIKGSDRLLAPAGWEGMKRIANVAASSPTPPAGVYYLRWSPEGANYEPSLPKGYDLRDYLSAGKTLKDRLELLGELWHGDLLQPAPPEWVSLASDGSPTVASLDGGGVGEGPESDCLSCESWYQLVLAWKKAVKLTKGLELGLSVIMACATSTRQVGDQLWVKMIGPPSSGKTVLAEALSVNRRFVYPKDTLTKLVSGYQSDKDGTENQSMVAHVKDKTLVINDGDTLLQLPNLAQVLSQFRAFYSRNLRSQFANKMTADFDGINTTVILCGTESLRSLDSSELGERFLDVVVVDEMEEELEHAISMRKARQVAREVHMVSDGKMESRDGPEMVLAKQLTGGYVGYLRRNAAQLLAEVSETDEQLLRCVTLAQFISFVRARPGKVQAEKVQRELSFRLTSQMVRLAKCLAVVLNRTTLDEEVLRRVTQVALDTARGRTLKIIEYLYGRGREGAENSSVAYATNESESKERELLVFLRKIHAVEWFRPELRPGVKSPKSRWRLTARMARLYQQVTGAAPWEGAGGEDGEE